MWLIKEISALWKQYVVITQLQFIDWRCNLSSRTNQFCSYTKIFSKFVGKLLSKTFGLTEICAPKVCKFYPILNPLSASPTKRSNTLKQFVVCCQQIVWVCLTILWGWRLITSINLVLTYLYWILNR